MLTIRHILCNPKYKGWYCGSKSQTVDYRSERKVFLDESEWVMYPDPSVPAIVSEELWDRANALYKARSKQMQAHASGADFHNRYPYSGKIICEEHGKGYHRQLYKTQAGNQEVWQCRVYRDRGRAGCCSPQLWTTDLNQIMARIFEGLVQDKEAVINAVMKVIEAVPNDRDFRREIVRVEEELQSLEQKKGRLLEMSIAGAINMAEFKKRNDGFNDQMQRLELQLAEIRQEEEKSKATEVQMQAVRAALEQKLSFENGVDAIIGSHSHIVGPMEQEQVTTVDGAQKTCFVAYSLGNFYSTMDSSVATNCRDGVVLNLSFTKNGETGETALSGVSYTPTYFADHGEDASPRYEILPVRIAITTNLFPALNSTMTDTIAHLRTYTQSDFDSGK